MKFFIDSGNLRDIEALVPLGIIDGVTTNPSLMAKESGDPRAHIKKICQLVKGPVSAEVVATDTAGMISEGRELAKIDAHVVVKVPFTRAGGGSLVAWIVAWSEMGVCVARPEAAPSERSLAEIARAAARADVSAVGIVRA